MSARIAQRSLSPNVNTQGVNTQGVNTQGVNTRGPVATPRLDWERVVHTVLVSRSLDELEETELLPARKVLYQFTARGHDVTQVLLDEGEIVRVVDDGHFAMQGPLADVFAAEFQRNAPQAAGGAGQMTAEQLAQARRMADWVATATGQDPANIKAGYTLDGTPLSDDYRQARRLGVEGLDWDAGVIRVDPARLDALRSQCEPPDQGAERPEPRPPTHEHPPRAATVPGGRRGGKPCRVSGGQRTSTTASTSTGTPAGRLATPTAARAWRPASPNASANSSEAPLPTWG
mgnify:CR=1 FL=1